MVPIFIVLKLECKLHHRLFCSLDQLTRFINPYSTLNYIK